MSETISIRLTPELASWIKTTARRTKRPRARIVREQLEIARALEKRPWMRWAGVVRDSPPDLSSRKGFSRE